MVFIHPDCIHFAVLSQYLDYCPHQVETLLDTIDGVSPVHSHFYLLASDLYRIQGKHAQFYRASLRYLGCTEVSELAKEEQVSIWMLRFVFELIFGFVLGQARILLILGCPPGGQHLQLWRALGTQGISFISIILSRREHFIIVSCQVLQSLKGSENEWLIDLLQTFNCGDMAK